MGVKALRVAQALAFQQWEVCTEMDLVRQEEKLGILCLSQRREQGEHRNKKKNKRSKKTPKNPKNPKTQKQTGRKKCLQDEIIHHPPVEKALLFI